MHAHGIIASVVSRFQSTPDLTSMRQDQLEDFIANSKLVEWQRQLVRGALDNTTAYRNQIEPFEIARTKTASRQFYLYFQSNGIFKQQFEQIDELILAALTEHEMIFQNQTREFNSIDRLNSEGEKMIKAAEAEVQKRLWDSTRQDTGSEE